MILTYFNSLVIILLLTILPKGYLFCSAKIGSNDITVNIVNGILDQVKPIVNIHVHLEGSLSHATAYEFLKYLIKIKT